MRIDAVADLWKVLADPTRVRLMALLAKEELTVAELTRITRLTQSRISTHLAKLKEAALVRDRRAGAWSYNGLDPNMPAAAREAWELVARTADDPLLDQDAERLAEKGTGWADSVAGQMERHYSPGRTWQATLRGLLGLLRLGRVLDVASGDCALAELIAPRADAIECLDKSATVLRAGRRRLEHLPHVRFTRADMHALPFDDQSFDHVLMLACLCYAAHPEQAIAEAARVLRTGGTLVAVTLHRHNHLDMVAKYDHLQPGYERDELHALFAQADLTTELCDITARERRPPHFEVLTVHATK